LYLKLSMYTLAFLRIVLLALSFSFAVLVHASSVTHRFLLGRLCLAIDWMVQVNKTQQVVYCHARATKFHHSVAQRSHAVNKLSAIE